MTYFEPALPFCLLVAAAGLVRAWLHCPRGRKPWLATIGLLSTILISLNATAWMASRPLEIWYSDDAIPREAADAIVVLSGSIRQPLPATSYRIVGNDTYVRLQWAVWLYKNWKSLPILVSGDAVTMRHVLESEGIPVDKIWVENGSRNTHENAAYSASVLFERGIHRIVLVVEARGMPRAAACFRKQGIHVTPAPAAFEEIEWNLTDLAPNWRAMTSIGDTLHETAGLVWYWCRGWI